MFLQLYTIVSAQIRSSAPSCRAAPPCSAGTCSQTRHMQLVASLLKSDKQWKVLSGCLPLEFLASGLALDAASGLFSENPLGGFRFTRG